MSGSTNDYKPYQVKVTVDGAELPPPLRENILQVSVEESLHLPSMFTLVLNNDYYPGREEDQPWSAGGGGSIEDLFAIGKPITIGFSTSTTGGFSEEIKDENLFEGEITAVETQFTSESQAPFVVRGYDVSHRLHRGRHNRSFQNVTDTDVIKRLSGEVGIPLGEVENSGAPYDYLFQANRTNMEFMRERAAKIGFELFVKDGKLNFRKPKKEETLDLKWLKDFRNFRTRVSSSEQVQSVEVRGWDYETKEPISVTKSTENVLTRNEYGTGTQVAGAFRGCPPPKMIVVDQPIFSVGEAEQMAQSLIDELGGEYVQADANGQGNPKIRAGKAINLKNISASSGGPQAEMGKYDGEYYVTECRHLYHKRTYTTEFSIRGLRGGSLLNTVSTGGAGGKRLNPAQTFLAGIVTDNKDPQGWGRVKVKFPTLTEEHTSFWARMSATGAGAGRGFDCLPEINDEVLCAFEHGDIRRPYIIGGVWNGKDAPPEDVNQDIKGDKVNLRTFKTRTGHYLQFVEEDNGGKKKGCYVETALGHKVNVNDSDKLIELETEGGLKITMDDRSKTITIDSNGSIKMKATRSMSFESQGSMDINATGTLNIKGAMVNIN